MAEEKKQSVTVYSYRKVWFVEKKIYAFQNIVLPFPIAPYEVLEFLAVVGAMLVMGRIFPILNNIPVVLRYGMLPYVTVKYLMKVKLDGKKSGEIIFAAICGSCLPERNASSGSESAETME